MYEGDNYSLMADYNVWMNRKLYGAAAGLPDAERKRDLGAFFKSLHGTLNHILLIDLMLLARFAEQPLPTTGLDEELHDDFGALRAEREATDARILDWIAGLDRSGLGETLTFTSVVDGKTRSLPSTTLGHADPDVQPPDPPPWPGDHAAQAAIPKVLDNDP